ncbi:hypothetical protein E4T47_08685 [Aureobasidium subglaciale]|nr:hypothetical protein E4T47_08685 [Aureobasidium subglaciale]
MAATRTLPLLSLEAAKGASEASQQKAEQIGVAINKAFTAAGHRVPTSHYNTPTFFPGGMGFGIQYTNSGRFCTLTGGVPIVIDGVVVGAIGVSSGTAEQDVEIAKTGIKAINTLIKKMQGPKL